MMREIDAEADDHRVILALEQDAGKLGAVDQQVVRPFDPGLRRIGRHHLVQRDRGDQRQRRRGRIVRPQADEGAGIEIAGRRQPRPALPALAAGLPLGAQPVPSAAPSRASAAQIVIGRAGLGDRADQKSEFAALIVAWPSTGMAR